MGKYSKENSYNADFILILEDKNKDAAGGDDNDENEKQGIVHIIWPETGLTQPGKTIVCGDSHTATHWAFWALAFGIWTSQVGHVLASQCLLLDKPKTMKVEFVWKPSKYFLQKILFYF